MSSSDEWNPHEKKVSRARKRSSKRKSENQLQKSSSKKFAETNVDISAPSCSGSQSFKAATPKKTKKRPWSILSRSKQFSGSTPLLSTLVPVGFRKKPLRLTFDKPKETPVTDPKLKGINIKHYLNFDSPVLEKFKEKKKDPEFLRLVARGSKGIKLSSDDDSNQKSKDEGGIDTSRDELFRNLLPSDSDEEYKDWAKVAGRKSITRVHYKGLPLPDENLLPNYAGVFESDSNPSSSHSNGEKGVDGEQLSSEEEKSEDAGKKESILLTLLSPNENEAKRINPYHATNQATRFAVNQTECSNHSNAANVSNGNNNLKEIPNLNPSLKNKNFGNRVLRVSLPKLSLQNSSLLHSYKSSNFSGAKLVNNGGKMRAKAIKVKLLPHEQVIDNLVPRVRLSKLPVAKMGFNIY